MTASMTGFSLRDDRVEGGRLVIELKTLNYKGCQEILLASFPGSKLLVIPLVSYFKWL